MGKWDKYLMTSFLALLLPIITLAGKPSVVTGKPSAVKWTVKNPFEQKVFIENKGQYQITGNVNNILYGASQEGLQYYFTANSIWIKKSVLVKRTKKEMEALEYNDEKNKSKTDNDDKERQYKMVDEFHEMTFIGANARAEITPDSEVSWYYNFTINKNIAVKAQAWKKIIYKNLYPGIDMEFYFPQDKQGFEYSFIVHSGADVSQIKIQYPHDKSVILTSEGNISMQSAYGEFTDHAPIATQKEAPQSISCRFTVVKPFVVQFNTGNYDKTKTLIIDPWTSTPLGAADGAFDVDYDDAGNCYVFGGTGPFQVIKLNSNGTPLWSATVPIAPFGAIGDFTVDKKSQSVYATDGYNYQGANVYKFNSSGAMITYLAPDPSYNDEFWRIKYVPSSNILFISGSGTGADSGELFTLDTSLTNFIKVDAYNLGVDNMGFHDIWGMAIDNFGNGYTAMATPGGTNFRDNYYTDELMVKCPLPSLTPTLWKVDDGYKFQEEGISYYSNWNTGIGTNCNFSGMACSCTDLFTYDGYVLKKWNLDTGNFLSSVIVEDSVGVNFNASGDEGTNIFNWGGLTSDDYGNIFLGANDSIKQYNSDFKLINTIDAGSGGNPIFDCSLNLNNRNTLYVCGGGFVSAVTVSPPTPVAKAQVQVTEPISCVQPYGSATVDTPLVPSPSDITWNTTPQQIGKTAVNLAPGTYIVTVNPGGCEGIYVDTITISVSNDKQVDTVSGCLGHPLILTGIPEEGNYVWTPSTGLSSSTGSSVVVASPTSNTTYTVISTLNNCADTDQINLLINPDPVVSVIPLSASICDGQGVNTFTASGASSYQWSPSNGLNETTGNQVTANPSVTTTYTITGINTTTGCSTTENFDVYVGNQPDASFSATAPVSCEPQIVQFANTSTGGSSYLWNFGDDSTSTEMSPAHTYSKAGNYKVTLVVASVPGCTDSTSLTESIQLGTDNVYVPTAFTPGKESNNYFSPNVVCTDASGYTFRVYNRWGELVYESSSPYQQGWDGKYNGVNQPQDTYVYYIELSCSGCKTLQKGDVTLLR